MVDPKYVSKHYNCEEIDQRLLQGYYDDFVDKTGYSGTKENFLTDLLSSINLPKDKKFSYLPANIGLEHFPEWSSGNKYIKGRVVVIHNSLLFRANSTHTSGASFDDDASLWSTTTLSELVEESLTPTITADEMLNFNPLADEGSSYLAGFLDKPSRYVVTKELDGVPVNVGILEILSDSSQHIYTQVFTTHFVLDNSGNLDLGSHSDTKLVTYFRSYSIDSPLIDSGTWTEWKDISHYKEILDRIYIEKSGREAGDTALTEALNAEKTNRENKDNELETTVNALVLGAKPSCVVSPNVIHKDVQTNIRVTGSISAVSASKITISGDDYVSSTESPGSSYAPTFNVTTNKDITFKAELVYNGVTFPATAVLYAVDKIYYGVGAEYTAATTVLGAQRTPAGTYSVTPKTDGDYIWWVVPSTMAISKATLNGFDFPISQQGNQTVNGVICKVYRSDNQYKAGVAMKIVVS